MLPVAIERHHDVTLGSVEPRGEGGLMAEVAAQLQDRHAGVVGSQLCKLGPGVVHGAVVDVADPDVVLASPRGRPPAGSGGAPAIRTRRFYGRSPLDRSGSMWRR